MRQGLKRVARPVADKVHHVRERPALNVLRGEILLKHCMRERDLAWGALGENTHCFRVYGEHLVGGVLRALCGIGEGRRVG
jgi:hypothetical protein